MGSALQVFNNDFERADKQSQIISFENHFRSKVEFDRAEIRYGFFDTLKFRLVRRNKSTNLIKTIKEILSQTFDKSDRISVYPKDNCYFIKDDTVDKTIGEFYQKIPGECTISLYGMNQYFNPTGLFNIPDHQKKILNSVASLDCNVYLEDADYPADIMLCSYSRSYLIYGNPTTENALKNHLEELEQQNLEKRADFIGFSVRTITIPKEKYPDLVDSITKNKGIKAKQNSKAYYQHVKSRVLGSGIVWYQECDGKKYKNSDGLIRYRPERSESTHIRVRLKKRRLFNKVFKLLENFKFGYSVKHDPENEIYIQFGRPKLSGVKYDKPFWDHYNHGDNETIMEIIRENQEILAMEYAENDFERGLLSKDFRSFRAELGLYCPGIKSTNSKPKGGWFK